MIKIVITILITLSITMLIGCSSSPNRIESVKEVNKIKIEVLNKVLSILEENNEIDSSDYTRLYVYPFYNYILEDQIESKCVTINRLVPINQLKKDYENSIMIDDLNIYIENDTNIAVSVILFHRNNSIDYYYILILVFKNNEWINTKYIKNEEPIKHFFK